MAREPQHSGMLQRVAALLPSLGMRPGSLLLEAIIAIGIFALFLGGIGLSLIVGERSTVIGGDRIRGAFYAEQQLEAVRQMRNTNFSALTAGTHGVALSPAGWTWSGTSVRKNGYTSWVTLTSVATDRVEVGSHVQWNFGDTRSGAILMTTQVTDWKKISTVGNWAAMTKIGQTTLTGTPKFQSIAVSGGFAYVTSDTSDGGKGLYVFDVRNPANPVRVASAFDLGAAAYGVSAVDNRLYLATNDTEYEVKVFDITDPANLSAGNLINTFNVQGSGRARSIAVYGSTVFVGRIDIPPQSEFISLHMSETEPMTLLDEIDTNGSVLGIALHDGYAYVSDAYNAGELQVIDIFDPANMIAAPGIGIDMPDVHNGLSIATTGTSALVGRAYGSTIDELTLYEIGASPVPSPPPGPWTLDTAGDVNAIATIFGSKYAFMGGGMATNQLRVLDLVAFAQNQPPVVKNYDTAGTVRGLAYDWLTDRLFVVTDSTIFSFAPG